MWKMVKKHNKNMQIEKAILAKMILSQVSQRREHKGLSNSKQKVVLYSFQDLSSSCTWALFLRKKEIYIIYIEFILKI